MLKVSDGAELEKEREEARGLLDEVVREGAQRMLIAALEAERDDYVGRLRELRDERGHARVVRNGYARGGRFSWEWARWR